MTVSTDAVRAWTVQLDASLDDNLTALAGGAQNSSPRLRSEVNRFTKVASAADSAQLPNIGTGESGGIARVVINDTANAVAVFASSGEKLNGSLNGSLSVTAGASAIFIPVPASATGGADWRAAVIP